MERWDRVIDVWGGDVDVDWGEEEKRRFAVWNVW